MLLAPLYLNWPESKCKMQACSSCSLLLNSCKLTCPGKAARTSCSVTSRTWPSLTSLRRWRTPTTRLSYPSKTGSNHCRGIKMACCTRPGFTQSSTSNSATSGCIMGSWKKMRSEKHSQKLGWLDVKRDTRKHIEKRETVNEKPRKHDLSSFHIR